MISDEFVKGAIRTSMAQAFSDAFVNGLIHAAENDRPLSVLQQEDMLMCMLMAFHTGVIEAEQSVDGEVMFQQLKSETEKGV